MGRSIVKIGDVFEIPLSDGRKAYGQYVYDNWGSIIRVFNYSTAQNENPDIDKIDTAKLLFPPIHGGVHLAIRMKMWTVIGKLPVDDYVYKGFLTHNPVLPMPKDKTEPVRIKSWSLWDGENWIELGEKLPQEYRDYQSGAIYPPDMVEKRIETGFDMFEYPKQYNRFLTEEELKAKMEAN